MTSNRRGFSRERHTELKLLIAALATCGFGLAWFGFARAHEPVVESVAAAPIASETPISTTTPSPTKARATATVTATAVAPAQPTPVPAAPTRTPLPAAPVPAQPSAAATVAGGTPKPAATPTTKKKSRGS